MPPPSFNSILNPTPTPNPLVRVTNNATEEEDSSVPFETALQRLSATLNEAVSFFNQLDHSFKEDTRSITLYAKSPVLDKIWRSKVVAVRQSHYHHYQQQQQQGNLRFKSRFITNFFSGKEAETRHQHRHRTLPPQRLHQTHRKRSPRSHLRTLARGYKTWSLSYFHVHVQSQ